MKTVAEEFALKSELARYLRMEPEDIDRAVAEDKLPCTKLLGSRKFSQRFPLRGVHAWLLERTENAPGEMRDFGRFREGFLMRGRKRA
jgi:hypothetical protein